MLVEVCKRGAMMAGLILGIQSFSSAQTWEVYDHNLNMTRKIENDNIKLLSESVRVSIVDQKLQLLNPQYKPFYTLKGNKIYQFLEPWIIVSEGEKYGVFHEYGEEILAPDFDEVQTYYSQLLAKKGSAYYYYDRGDRKVRTLGAFDEAFFSDNGQIIAKTPQGYFLPLSKNPNKIYQKLEVVNDKTILAQESTGLGLINREGEYILDPVIDKLDHVEGDFYFGFDAHQYMLIKATEQKADIKYTSYHRIAIENDVMLEYIHGKLRRVMKNDGILLDIIGMDSVRRMDKEHYNVYFRDHKVGLLNAEGKWDVSPSENITKIFPGNEGLYAALIDGKYGFVDKAGKLRIANRYDSVSKYTEGLAPFKVDNRWGYLDKNDRIAIQPQYEEVGDFHRGIAIVKKGGKSNLIDKNGKELLGNYYRRISLTDDNYYLTEDEEMFGLVNASGSEISIPKFDEIRRENYDHILVKRGNKYGLMRESGEYSLPIYYKNIIYDRSNELILAEDEYIPPVVENIEESKKKKKKGA
ncbi:WG repeat-containing protein [Litoribacter populi]|uniref:WG repeat-containing protein n=1 Tax=Litoribacter populi TaxID=2598460 RepID=UPI00117F2562|nr:WG repeat-containing protein [Litoribacter populi]